MLIINSESQLESLCNTLANILTHSNIDKYLKMSNIEDVSTKSQNYSGYYYTKGDNKPTRIYNCFANELNKSHNDVKIIRFIELSLDPAMYSNDAKKYSELLDSINSSLLFMGCKLTNEGKVIQVPKATTVDEVQKRINSLLNEASKRNIHQEVLKYCKREYLDKDYFHAQFEAVKGLFQRIRDLTNQSVDGAKLINGVFSPNEPMLLLNGNNLSTRTEIDEYTGFKYLFLYLQNAVRNQEGHTPRILSKEELNDCLDNFTVISRCHNYLDNCTVTCYANAKKLQ